MDERLQGEADDENDMPLQKRRRGGDVGRDWLCEVEGCDKSFKSVGGPASGVYDADHSLPCRKKHSERTIT